MTTTPITPTPTTPPSPRSGSGRRALLVSLGTLLILTGVILLAIGGTAVWANQQRDADGYFRAGPERVSTETSALSVPSLEVSGAGPDDLYADDFLGDVRLQVESRSGDVPVFVGIGPAAEVAKYLDGVRRDEVSDLDVDPFELVVTTQPGGRPAAAPATQSFWVASEMGTGRRTLGWNATEGDWTVVIMNADGSPFVDADVSIGGKLPAVQGIAVGALIGSALFLAIGTAIMASVLTRSRR
jgi:hypothetical protein